MKKSTLKSDLTKKIKTYSAFATALLAVGGSAKSQVVYTDVNPDETINGGEQYSLDFNGDNNADFGMFIQSGTYTFSGMQVQYNIVGLQPASSNEVNFTTASSYGTNKYYGPVANSKGVKIDSKMDWSNQSYFLMGFKATVALINYTITGGDWVGVQDKYAALKFVDGNNTYFGWARMDMNSDVNQLVIKDYAYNSSAGYMLSTGDTLDLGLDSTLQGSSIKAVQVLNNVSVYSFHNSINVNFLNGQLPKGNIYITNSLGQEVYTTAISEATTQILLNETAGNMYVVSIQTEKGNFVKKVFLRNR